MHIVVVAADGGGTAAPAAPAAPAASMKALVMGVILTTSTSALACFTPIADFFTGPCPFEGQEVPRNSELRLFGFDEGVQRLPLTVPDGRIVDVEVARDQLSAFLVITELVPGPHRQRGSQPSSDVALGPFAEAVVACSVKPERLPLRSASASTKFPSRADAQRM
ncbi:MAG: hypothetical protein Q8O67_32095 [Deltaproteobacteria bacterium]|nr:hypothetical protein [Deltaproteobacteria bacterium]